MASSKGQNSAGASPKRVRVASGRAPSEQMSEIQRLRILTAMAEVASEYGAGTVTVAHVVTKAGVSRRTFYELFGDREECLLATFDDAVARAAARVRPAYESQSGWPQRIRAGLLELLVFLDEEPALARMCIVQALAAGPKVLEHRARVVEQLVAAVDEGRAEVRRGTGEPLPMTADGVVGAVLSLIHVRLLTAEPEPVTELLGVLMSVIVLPYLGQGAARREFDRPAPSSASANGAPRAGALEDLPIRITYRTVSVLRAIARRPGASNREIARQAGIQDDGQVSKLLNRLRNLGLIDNLDADAAKSAPNAWQLTPRGHEVEQAVRIPTEASSG